MFQMQMSTMDLDGTANRRKKPMTYGKSMRKTFPTYKSKASKLSTDDVYAEALDIEIDSTEKLLEEELSFSHSFHGQGIPRLQRHTSSSSYRSTKVKSRTGDTATKNNPDLGTHRGGSLYDVPSSEDEKPAAKDKQSCAVYKRKRVCKSPVSQETEVVCQLGIAPRLDVIKHTPNLANLGMVGLSISTEPQSHVRTRQSRPNTDETTTTRPIRSRLSRAKIVDRLSRPGGRNPRRINQGFEEEHTKMMSTRLEVPETKQVSSSNEPEDGSFSSSEQDSSCDGWDALHLSEPNPATIMNTEGLKVTYARQRSFLTGNDVKDDTSFSTPIVASDASTKASSRRKINGNAPPQVQPRPRFWDENDGSDNITYSSIRSIHELREAGGNARVVGELETILDDIDNGVRARPSLLCNYFLDLSMKLEEPANCQLLVGRGLDARLVEHVSSFSDSIINMLLMVSFLQVMNSSCTPNIIILMSDPVVLEYFGSFLGETADDASLALSRFSTTTQKEVSRFFKSLQKLPIWKYGQPLQISARVLALQCLDHVVRHVREASGTSIILSPSIVTELVKVAVPIRNDPEIYQVTVVEIQLAVSTLESTNLVNMALSSEETRSYSCSIDRMAQLLPQLRALTREPVEELRTLALRLCLNFTNNSRVPCEAFASLELVYAVMSIISRCFDQLSQSLSAEKQGQVSDQLVLALGLLINIAEWNGSARQLFLVGDVIHQRPLDTLLRLFNANLCRASEVKWSIEVSWSIH